MSENETTKCKHCQSDIPKKAKICPVCKKKQKGNVLLGIILLFVGIALIVAALGGGEDESDVTRVDSSTTQQGSTATSSESAEPEDLTFGIGETAEYNNIRVTLTNVSESTGSQFNTPADGNIFVLAEFEIENNSDKDLAISSLISFSAYQDGYVTNLSFTALMENEGEQLDGSIAPGKKMKGSIGYEIPANFAELEINVQLDVWSSKKIVFVYSK